MTKALAIDATVRQVEFLQERGRLWGGNSLQDCGETLVMDTVPILDGLRVSQIQTCERLVLKHQVKDLLLEFAPINAVILYWECDKTLVIDDPFEKRLKSKVEIIERKIEVSQFACFSDNLGECLRWLGSVTLFFKHQLPIITLVNDELTEPLELQIYIFRQLQVFLSSHKKLDKLLGQNLSYIIARLFFISAFI